MDNYGILSCSPSLANSTQGLVDSAMTQLGLQVHEQTSASASASFVGLELSHNRLRVKVARLWKLRRALEHVLHVGYISGSVLEVLIGHVTWSMLVRREALAFLHHSYRFIHSHYHSRIRIPSCLALELRTIVAILPLLFSQLDNQWSTLVHASDASESGLGVCTRRIPAAEVGAIGRCHEKWRFKTEDAIQARAHALLTPPGLSTPPIATVSSFDVAAQLNCLDPDSFDAVVDSVRRFDEVPNSWLDPKTWSVVHSSQTTRTEHITRSEGRALVWSACHALRSLENHNKRCLFLVDNMSLCLGVSRGRSSAPSLRYPLRQLAALSLATGSRLVCRWIPSETNIADGPP